MAFSRFQKLVLEPTLPLPLLSASEIQYCIESQPGAIMVGGSGYSRISPVFLPIQQKCISQGPFPQDFKAKFYLEFSKTNRGFWF